MNRLSLFLQFSPVKFKPTFINVVQILATRQKKGVHTFIMLVLNIRSSHMFRVRKQKKLPFKKTLSLTKNLIYLQLGLTWLHYIIISNRNNLNKTSSKTLISPRLLLHRSKTSPTYIFISLHYHHHHHMCACTTPPPSQKMQNKKMNAKNPRPHRR